jgi:excisionase family DNA binding protein
MANELHEQLERIENLLQAQKKVLNLNEAAELTGFSKSYLYKMTSKGLIPHYKPTGKQIFFNRVELEQWLLNNRQTTQEEAEKEALSYVTLKKKGGL